jgi:GTPase SAR1 family protein
MDLNLFNEKKSNIKHKYENMIDISRKLELFEMEKSINNSITSLENDSFNIVVVGEFSRGKSTFINALLGQRVLPSATKPTTTVINKISAGDEIEYILNFRDEEDKQVVISENEFKELVAPIEPDFDNETEVKEYNEKIEYISSISYANIKYPTKLLKDGVEIIDTPGTNDLDQAREEITFKFIPQSDAAILVLSATQILSDSEVAFLKERILGNDINKIFFVINAKDKLMSASDEKKVFDYAYEHLNEYVKNPKIFMVSSRSALNFKRRLNGESVKGQIANDLTETGFDSLEHEIGNYLMNERGKIKLDKYYNRGIKIASEIINSNIKYRLSTVDISIKELEQKVHELVPVVKDTRNQVSIILNQLKSSLKGLENDYLFMYKSGLEEIALRANMSVNYYEGPLEIDNISREIEQTVAPLQKHLDQEVKDFKVRYIDTEVERATTKLASILNNLNLNMDKQLVPVKNSLSLNHKHNLSVSSTDGGLQDHEGLFGGLIIGGVAFLFLSAPFIIIPAAMFGGKYIESMFQAKKRNNFLAQVKIQIERRYGEIIPKQVDLFRKSYNDSISQSVTVLESNVNDRINGLEAQLNKLLDDKKSAQKNIDLEIANLNHLQKQLHTIISDFERELMWTIN